MERLADYMLDIGWTQRALARRVGADPATISRWVRGSTKCPGKVLAYVREVAEFHRMHQFDGLQAPVEQPITPRSTDLRAASAKVRDRAQWSAVAAAIQRDRRDE